MAAAATFLYYSDKSVASWEQNLLTDASIKNDIRVPNGFRIINPKIILSVVPVLQTSGYSTLPSPEVSIQ